MEHLTMHNLLQNMNDKNMQHLHEAMHDERVRRFRTWPVARLLQIMYETRDFAERNSFLIILCDWRIEPVMTGGSNESMFDARQNLLDLLAFKEWYDANNDKRQDVDAVLKRYTVQDLRAWIDIMNQAYDLAFMQATHPRLGATARVHELSQELLRDITRYSHI